jgi:hypothetical protein
MRQLSLTELKIKLGGKRKFAACARGYLMLQKPTFKTDQMVRFWVLNLLSS